MRKLAALAGAAALGLGLQSAAHAYSATASVTFTWGGSANDPGADQGFVSSAGPIPFGTGIQPDNTTLIHGLTNANSTNFYNENFAAPADCTPGGGVVPAGATVTLVRKYGCRYTTTGSTNPQFAGTLDVDTGPLAKATGTITVTDTTLTGTLTIVNVSDEPTGATTTFNTTGGFTVRLSPSVGDGFAGYNLRLADGSPFGNAWYGITSAGTYTLNLTGTFTSTSWNITGGSATFTDAGFACQQGGFGGVTGGPGTLCAGSTTGGGFNPDGSMLSWGMDPDATGPAAVAPIVMRDDNTSAVLATFSGVIATMTIAPNGVITTTQGEIRRAFGNSSGCADHIRYNTSDNLLHCGTLSAGNLVITGTLPDSDGDGVPDATDNCRSVANNTGTGAQCDSDHDGFGNRCDGDFINPAPGNGVTNSQDYAFFRSHLGITTTPPVFDVADLNCNGTVNSQDYAIFRTLLGSAPGPGAGP